MPPSVVPASAQPLTACLQEAKGLQTQWCKKVPWWRLGVPHDLFWKECAPWYEWQFFSPPPHPTGNTIKRSHMFTQTKRGIPYASLQWFIPSKTSAWPQGRAPAQLQWAVQRCGSAGWFSLPQKDPSRRPPPQPAPNRSHHLGAFGHLREPTFQKANASSYTISINLPWLHGNP